MTFNFIWDSSAKEKKEDVLCVAPKKTGNLVLHARIVISIFAKNIPMLSAFTAMKSYGDNHLINIYLTSMMS
ncbi:Hypothetical predicted protein [Octopus vulgaris]|uniref:Uncharacterized protein n=1 Tax=Octopus vulgaris TaxID=6645 RepID=A0AA36ANT4_OCTVU|nr:Hypothetical predicted protein [Octopus vulgaris]